MVPQRLNLLADENVSPRVVTFLREKCRSFYIDGLVKSLKSVTPAKAGVQNFLILLDSGFRRNDRKAPFLTFYEFIYISP